MKAHVVSGAVSSLQALFRADEAGFMDNHSYLGRISYNGELSPTHGVLSALQEAHLLSVPFENLDIHRGVKIVLDLPRLFQKVVVMMRGGFCYELNGLFHWLLQDLGFRAKLLMARVYNRTRNEYGAEFDHMLIQVDLEDQSWIVDVGFGELSMHPLAFVLNQDLVDTNGRFLIEKETDEWLRVARFSGEENQFVPEYKFSVKERRLGDFSAMCLYHQTSPQSHFTRNRICSIATPAGRISLSDDKLIITERGMKNETPIGSKQEFDRVLDRYFSIRL
jgi:N-hydroxyarylamine O-acetyltransferase